MSLGVGFEISKSLAESLSLPLSPLLCFLSGDQDVKLPTAALVPACLFPSLMIMDQASETRPQLDAFTRVA